MARDAELVGIALERGQVRRNLHPYLRRAAIVPARHLLQHCISDSVAQRVVDLFEAVQVKEHDREA